METPDIEFSGRSFSAEDIELIKWTRKTYPKLSKEELASTICEFLDWNTPAGKAKAMQCKALLDMLADIGMITLPDPPAQSKKRSKIKLPKLDIDTSEVVGGVKDYEPIELELIKRGERMKRWRAYVNQYHMLGDKQAFGSRLQYFVRSGEKELGCLQFSASAWALEDRDHWIGWNEKDKKARLHLIVNNSRFLIFPWVHIKYLASKALALAASQIQEDWLREYCYAPVLLETFVDLEHFKGTCYKAANWIYIGETKGRGRMDRYKEYALSKKAIYMYPLQKDYIKCLKGEKPYKSVKPDD